jgi:hypothetical protein
MPCGPVARRDERDGPNTDRRRAPPPRPRPPEGGTGLYHARPRHHGRCSLLSPRLYPRNPFGGRAPGSAACSRGRRGEASPSPARRRDHTDRSAGCLKPPSGSLTAPGTRRMCSPPNRRPTGLSPAIKLRRRGVVPCRRESGQPRRDLPSTGDPAPDALQLFVDVTPRPPGQRPEAPREVLEEVLRGQTSHGDGEIRAASRTSKFVTSS